MAVPKIYHLRGAFKPKYHRQDAGDDCGQACAQMLLQSVESELHQQDELVDTLAYDCVGAPIGTEQDGWGANPGCMEQKLNDEAGNPSTQRNLKLMDCNSEKAASHAIAHSLRLGGIPSTVLVNDMSHWVAVYGCDIASDPDDYVDCLRTPYDIRAFYVHDPAPNPVGIEEGQLVEFDPSFQLHRLEDECGQGVLEVVKDQVYNNWGLARRRIRHDGRVKNAYWPGIVFTGVSRTPSHYWDKKYLAVVDVTKPFDEKRDCRLCDAEIPGGGRLNLFKCNEPEWSKNPNSFHKDDVTRIQVLVMDTLRKDGLMVDASGAWLVDGAPQDWRDLLKETEAIGVHPVYPPYIGDGFHYFLVEMVVQNDPKNGSWLKKGDIPVVVVVSACKGNEQVLEMAAVGPGGHKAIQLAPLDLFTEAVKDNQRYWDVEIAGQGVITFPKDGVHISEKIPPRLVWKPAQGGLSPYAPFYRVDLEFTLDSRTLGTIPFFVRADFWGWRKLLVEIDMSTPGRPVPLLKTEIFRKYEGTDQL